MVIDAENSEMHQVRDFIAANWSLFTSHIREKSMTDEQAEEEAQRIFVVVGGVKAFASLRDSARCWICTLFSGLSANLSAGQPSL
ncbi:hypothetical protein [Escherichia coli]|uniref:hypothetical protein n=1 Tax=Escherichia coli TaxID=562 RepID=UPI000BE4FC3E|nr:hypothetical protein [Escherichia coli]